MAKVETKTQTKKQKETEILELIRKYRTRTDATCSKCSYILDSSNVLHVFTTTTGDGHEELSVLVNDAIDGSPYFSDRFQDPSEQLIKDIVKNICDLFLTADVIPQHTHYSILVWSNGYEMYHCQFSGSTQEEADHLARQQMWKEYDDHNCDHDASEEYGSYKGDYDCCYGAEWKDLCIWKIIPVEVNS